MAQSRASGLLSGARVLCKRGVTLTELMIAVAVLSVAILGLVAAFGGIQRGIQIAKNKTLAANLAQEKMQIIKQQTYFRVIPTASPSFLSDGTPYDTANFPPQTIVEGSVSFTRYTYVQVVSENSGVLNFLSPTTPDTGMRHITVTVVWQQGGERKTLSVNSVLANPNTIEANSVFTGLVTNNGGAAIPNALVTVAENVGWRDSTDSVGRYTIRLSPGSFNLVATADGYFSQFIYLSVGANNSVSHDFPLVPMSSGTVTGYAWVSQAPVISQVVVSSVQANTYDVEYIELFNGTTSTYTMTTGAINLNMVSGFSSLQCANIPLTYVNASFYPNNYYLIANTTTFTINGATVTADAYYQDTANSSCSPSPSGWNPPSARPILQRSHSNTVYITNAAGAKIDAVGWTNNGAMHNPSYCDGTCIYQPPGGLPAGEQVVRTSSPSWTSSVYGKVYDSGNNSIDFAYPGASGSLNLSGIAFSPSSTAGSKQSVVAGAPAVGAVVTASDGLSDSTAAYSSGSPPMAKFSLTKVATGTWTVLITSGVYELENDTVTMTASGSVYAFPSSTTILNGAATASFISGRVVDAFGTPIAAPSAIKTTGAGQTVSADAASGRYLLRVSSNGAVDVTANPNYLNPNYISVSSVNVPVTFGQVTNGVDFVLSQGGRLSGWVTRDGTNGLQGVTVTATDVNGNVQDQQVTDVNGNFKTVNLATGTYTVQIPLDTTESSSPTSRSGTAVLGTTVFVGSFTITGALGTIAGNVTLSGSPISTGVLIIASTGTITTPPVLSSNSLTAGAYYVTSSLEDGTYSLDVRKSTYNLYGYYTTVTTTGAVTITPRSLSNISIDAGQSVSGKNLAW